LINNLCGFHGSLVFAAFFIHRSQSRGNSEKTH
jgi:hypothetical protein